MVKCNLTRLTTKSSWYFQLAVFVWYYMLRALRHCASVFKRGGLCCVFDPQQSTVKQWSIRRRLSAPPPPPPSRSHFPHPLLTQCDRCLKDCIGAHGWVVGIASHGSVILSRGRLVTVEASGYPRHPSSIQHDAVVNYELKLV